MRPDWLDETVRAFGRQMGLQAFALNERGAAGVRFENGVALRLEYAEGALLLSAGVAADESERTLKALLAGAHPGARTGVRLRAVRVARDGEARFVARLAEREVTLTALEGAFQALWQAVDRFRRAIA